MLSTIEEMFKEQVMLLLQKTPKIVTRYTFKGDCCYMHSLEDPFGEVPITYQNVYDDIIKWVTLMEIRERFVISKK